MERINTLEANPWLAAVATLDEGLARQAAGRGAWAVVFYEFLCFGVKQAWACLFGGAMVALLYFGREIFIPLALAVLLSFALSPVVFFFLGA